MLGAPEDVILITIGMLLLIAMLVVALRPLQ